MLGCAKQEPEVSLFSYFRGNGEDGLHLAASKDGLNWNALNNDESFLIKLISQKEPDMGQFLK